MRKNIRNFIVPIFLLILGLGAARAQQPTDSLGGRTVHVFLPSPAIDTLVIQNINTRMTKDGEYWYSYKFVKSGLYDNTDGFYFTDPSHRIFFSKAGMGSTEAPRFLLADFQGAQEIWIIVDPAGPATAKPVIMLTPPKIVNVLNPWTTTAPKLMSGTKTRNMTTVTGRCGWFSAMLLDTTMTTGYFQEVNNTDTYGKGGLGSKEPFDLATLFAANGPTLWLNTQANSWTATWPNINGECQYLMAVTVRDFSAAHPDFDFGSITGDHSVLKVVQDNIGPDPDRKPILNPANATKDPSISFKYFDEWWVTDSTRTPAERKNYQSCYDIPMSKASDGGWEYDSYRDSPDHGFWPVEGTGLNRFNETMSSCYVKPPPDSTSWVTGGPKRNGNFCMESHATFIYQKGQKFDFRGDDDVWVFINNKLVVDLGGVHTPKSSSVNLDNLSLTEGSTYKWDLFYCDRQPCGSSLRIKTSIYFKQQRGLYGIELPGPTPGSVSMEIWKRSGGTGSCASIGGVDSSKASNLTYQILDASGKVIETLENGKTVHGGITVNTPVITVDTSKITTTVLVPGQTYRVVAFEPANQSLKVEVPFKVPVRNYVDFDSPATATVPVGTLVMVIASNRDQAGAKTTGVINYIPNIPAGLKVYTNAAGTVPAPSTLSTGADGLDTIWVTADPAPSADKTFILSLPAPAKTTPTLTFTVPTDRVEFVPPLSRDNLVGTLVVIDLQAVDKTGPQAKAVAYQLKIPAGLKVYSDAAGTVPTTGGTTAADGKARIYATADSTNPVDQTYILEITTSTPTMTLKFRMPPLDIPKAVSAGIYDDDGDGIGDRIEAVYDRDIAATPPKSAGYKWPSTATAVNAAGTASGKTYTLKGQFSTTVLTSGTGVYLSTYTARKADSTQSIPLDDRIGPIIKAAEIFLGKTEDTLRIRFSEPISATGPAGAPASWFGIKRSSDGTVEYVAPAGAPIWKDDRSEVAIVYTNTAANVPRAGNLVRIEDGKTLITDERGNTAGPGSRFRVITGGKRPSILTVTYKKLTPQEVGSKEPIVVTLEPSTAEVKEVVERTGRLGHLLKTDLGAFAVGDDFNPVSPSQVVLDYNVSYFTNHGVPVADAKGSIKCTDEIYKGDCTSHRGFIFLGWKGITNQGDKVGTGAYIARVRYVIKVAGQAKEPNGLDQMWGVVRQ